MSSDGEGKWTENNSEILGTKENMKLYASTNLLLSLMSTKYKGDVP